MTAMKLSWKPRLRSRILLGAGLVLVVGALTSWAVALLTGPLIFHEHMLMVEAAHPDPDVVAHAEEAFDQAWQLSLALALITACLMSVLVSAFLARRITATLDRARGAALRVASGDYEARVPESDMGAELADLASAFNRMAAELADTEQTRKRLLSDLAHEMRTPVATVDGYLEGMLDGVAEADSQTIMMLREQTDRLRRLAEDISLVSTAEEHGLSVQSETISLAELAQAAEAQARSAFRSRDITFSTEDHADGAMVNGDWDRLSQVLTNLLDNALRHTEKGDKVTLRATRSRDTAVLQVEDSGRGIPDEHLPHLFERFYRVDTARDRAHGGSGIGLTIVRSIVEAHSGRVTVDSGGSGQGSTFTVQLPLADKGTHSPAAFA